MKRIMVMIICFMMLLSSEAIAAENSENVWMSLYVSYEKGSDANDGKSASSPIKTIEKAKEIVRAESEKMSGDIVVNIMEGNHFLNDTLYFSPQDSGKNGYDVIYRGENMPIVSGGMLAPEFKKSDKGVNIYEAYMPGLESVHSIFVNDVKRRRASSETMVTAIKFWNDPNTRYSDDGLYMKKSDIGFFENPEDIQFYYFKDWVQNFVMVEEILPDPDSEENVIVRMDRQIWTYSNPSIDTKWRTLTIPFYIHNAMELMDTPGECYYNKKTGMLYYIPTADENMETATVIVPVHDKIIDIYGYDTDDKVKNITFEGIEFAHSAWHALAQTSSTPRQAQAMLGWFNDISMTVPGAIELEMTENINFKNNRFFGLQQAGLYLKNGVCESDVTGNAFYNIGDAGIVVGQPYRYDDKPEYDFLDGTNVLTDGKSPDAPNEKGLKRMVNAGDTMIATSYWSITEADHKITNLHTTSSGALFMRNWIYEKDYEKYRGTWKSNPDDIGKKRSWVRYSFDRPYKLSEITLTFDMENTVPSQRMGYEVLLSNDKNFVEYDTVGVSTQDSLKKATFAVPAEMQEKEYKYAMIRTVGKTQMALSGAFFMTDDIAPGVMWERCTKINFSNNLVTSVGEYDMSSGGVSVFSASETKISHNKISNLPYSAIMIGWGWMNSRITARDIEVSHNHIENIGLVLHDGGGVYSLGRQRGTKVHDNYVKNGNFSLSAYYLDEGTSSTEWTNNVALGIERSVLFMNTSGLENVVKENYADAITASIKSDAKQNVFDKPIFVDYPKEKNEKIESIIANAGLQEEYRYLENEVGEREYKLPYHYEICVVLAQQAATSQGGTRENVNSFLNNNQFGNKKGQYSADYFFEITRTMEEFMAGNKNEEYEDLLLTYRKRNENINGEDLEESDIWCVYAPGATDYSIDADNLTLTLDYPYKAYLKDKKLSIYCSDGKKIAYYYDNTDLSAPVKIPVYSEKTKTYNMWTLKVNQPTATDAKEKISKDDWCSTEGETIASGVDGGRYLKPSLYTYEAMYKTLNNKMSFGFLPSAEKNGGKYTFIIGTESKDESSQLEVEFFDGKATLYESYNGQKNVISTTEFMLDAKTLKNVEYTLYKENENKTAFNLSVNGKLLFSSAVSHIVDNSRIRYYSVDSGIIVY